MQGAMFRNGAPTRTSARRDSSYVVGALRALGEIAEETARFAHLNPHLGEFSSLLAKVLTLPDP